MNGWNHYRPVPIFLFRRDSHACTCYWQAETKQTFFLTALFIRPMVSPTTYSSTLNCNDRKKYEEELITIDGTVLPDLYMLVENWKSSVKLLPDITWVDFYNYLINTPSLYLNKNLKAYVFRSLQILHFWSCTWCCIKR